MLVVRKFFNRSPSSSRSHLTKPDDSKSEEKILFCARQLNLISGRLSLLINAILHLSTSHIDSKNENAIEAVAAVIKNIKDHFIVTNKIEELVKKAEKIAEETITTLAEKSSAALAREIAMLHDELSRLSKNLDTMNKKLLNSALSDLKEALKFPCKPETLIDIAENEQKCDSNKRVKKAMLAELLALDKAIPYPHEFDSLHNKVVSLQIDEVEKIDPQNTEVVNQYEKIIHEKKNEIYNNIFTIFSRVLANADFSGSGVLNRQDPSNSPEILSGEIETMQRNLRVESYPNQLQLYTFTVRLFNLPKAKTAESVSSNKMPSPKAAY
jgi:hypothetical protein